MTDLEVFLKRWYKYARFGKLTDSKKRAYYAEQMDYIEKVWKELKDAQRLTKPENCGKV